jgi:hypothetical protein
MRAALGLSSECAETNKIVPTAAPTTPTPIPMVESRASLWIASTSLCDDGGQAPGQPFTESSRDLSLSASTPNTDPKISPAAPIPNVTKAAVWFGDDGAEEGAGG